ncbi:uncharacterized protein [Venturia canescens]|uniref:uncharacterized protein n=1 Tax=Venturia canescens TaxID=32260 RepID=UPI001C9BED2F|nr:uncharacterized protein LOC122409176 [Venturia canescens]
MEKQVLYALISHWEPSNWRIIADSTSEDSSIYRDIIIEVMKSTFNTEEECISIQRGNYTVHLLIGELRYAALTLTPDGPIAASRQASSSQIFLNRLRCVYRELPILVDFPCDIGDFPAIDISLPLKKILDEFNCPEQVVVTQMKGNLTEIRRVLMENVQKLIDRGQKLDELVRKTQTLEITTRRDFQRSHKISRKKNIVVVIVVVIMAGLATIISTVAITFFY